MNRTIHVLLTVALLASMSGVARAETMEERKQRIMRKYMRERQDIVQSDLGVPDTPQEQKYARVAESELFKEPLSQFKRQEGGVPPRPITPAPVPVQTERNWWLETSEMEADPYADPFSSKRGNREAENSRWSPWDNRDDSSVYESVYGRQQEEQNDIYSGSQDDSFIYGDIGGQQWGGSREETYSGGRSAHGMQNESAYGSQRSGTTFDGYGVRGTATHRERSDYDGRSSTGTRRMGAGSTLDSSGRSRASPSTGLLQPSFPSSTDTQGFTSQDQTTGYTPYRSSYQVQDEQQRRSGGNLQPQQTPYVRPNNYQKWKDNNKAWDPTSGNSYLDELMQDQRR